MRTPGRAGKDRELVLVDGVKVLHDDGWALALPDPEEPVTHVWAEGADRRRRPGAGPGVRPPDPPAAAVSRPGSAVTTSYRPGAGYSARARRVVAILGFLLAAVAALGAG